MLNRLLQWFVGILALVPILAGGVLAAGGAEFLVPSPNGAADSHIRYLSGLLLGIGLAFWSCIPAIEHKTQRFRLLTAIVFVGGLARLCGLLTGGSPSPITCGALVMELAVTPLLCWWQSVVAKNSADRR